MGKTSGRFPRSNYLKRPIQQQVVKNSIAIKKLTAEVAGEMHYVDTELGYTTSTVDYNGLIYDLTAVGGGSTATQRVGNSFKPRSIEMQFSIEQASLVVPSTSVHMMIVRDNWGTGSVLASNLFWQTSGDSKAAFSHMATTWQFQKRFTILKDIHLNLNPAGGNAKYFSIKLKPTKPVMFTDIAGTDEGKNHIYVYIISDKIGSLPTFVGRSRLGFVDN